MQKSYKISSTLTAAEMTKEILTKAKDDGFTNFKLAVSTSEGEMVGDELVGCDLLDNTITVTLTQNEPVVEDPFNDVEDLDVVWYCNCCGHSQPDRGFGGMCPNCGAYLEEQSL